MIDNRSDARNLAEDDLQACARFLWSCWGIYSTCVQLFNFFETIRKTSSDREIIRMKISNEYISFNSPAAHLSFLAISSDKISFWIPCGQDSFLILDPTISWISVYSQHARSIFSQVFKSNCSSCINAIANSSLQDDIVVCRTYDHQ